MEHTATYSPEDNKLRLYPAYRLDKELYTRVRGAGFIWAPKQELFVAPMWTTEREDLLLELCGEIGDEDKSLVERQEERAERFEDYSDKRAQDAEQARESVDYIAQRFEGGQPILVGHHSERKARKDAEKIENGMRKAIKMWETSQYWEQRAAGALRHAKYKEMPTVRARRIKTIEAEIRSYRARYTPSHKQVLMQQEWKAGAVPTPDAPRVPHVFCAPRGGRGGSWVPLHRLAGLETYYSRWIQHCENRLTYERAMLNEQGATDLLKPKPKKEQLPLCNYRAPEGLDIENIYRRNEIIHYPQIEMTQAEYAKICTDYKGTRVVGNSHRVRTAMRSMSLHCVFITDSKTHTPPAPVARVSEPTQRETVYRESTPSPEAAKFDQLRSALKGGVQVVSAPQLFPTPPELAARMVELADVEPGARVLEPSAGTGNILREILNRGGLLDAMNLDAVAVELNYNLASLLSREFQTSTVKQADFLECNGDLGKFDRVIMNPPFENGADIKHIKHALHMLKPGGRLVAICAGGPRQKEALEPLASLWEPLPAGTFKESGTGVSTVLLTIEA